MSSCLWIQFLLNSFKQEQVPYELPSAPSLPVYGTAWLKQQLLHSPFFCSRARNLSHLTDIDFTFRNYLDGTLFRILNKRKFGLRNASDDPCTSVCPLLQLHQWYWHWLKEFRDTLHIMQLEAARCWYRLTEKPRNPVLVQLHSYKKFQLRLWASKCWKWPPPLLRFFFFLFCACLSYMAKSRLSDI